MDWASEYARIVRELGLEKDADRKAAEVLDGLIQKADIERLRVMGGKIAIVFGAGPSLPEDIRGVKSGKLHRDGKVVLIAADGAVKALLKNGVVPAINVTDLDGDLEAIKKANGKGTVTVVHAHGDNVELLKKIVPELKEPIGTTQTKATGKVHNFGGFTDGDRAAFLADRFGAELIVLAGMDFGDEIGRFSGSYDREKKLKKLQIGKGLLEKLARESRAGILNLTSRGEDLAGIPRTSVKALRELV